MPHLNRLDDTSGPTARDADGFAPRPTRLLTIFLVARLTTRHGDDLCRIRNISQGGLMLETSAPLAIDDTVRIEPRNLSAVDGRVVWTTAPRAGIAFDVPSVIAHLLHAAADQRNSTLLPRSPRISSECPVLLRRDGHATSALLIDISQGGGKVRVADTLKVHDQVSLEIPNLPHRRAVVRWVREQEVGLAFFEVIPFAELDGWLGDRSVRFGRRSGQA